MTQVTSNNYWIGPNVLTISLNALGNSEYIQCAVASGAVIMCYVKGIIDYDNGHNYKRWTLNAYPTIFADSQKKYVYVAIPRSDSVGSNALICFPSVEIDIYGCSHSNDGAEDDVITQVGSENYYYINLQGIISESQTDEQRESGSTDYTDRIWTQRVVTGVLATDEAIASPTSDWWSYSSVDDVITFLKDITFKAGKKFLDFFVQKITFKDASNVEQGSLESVPTFTDLDTDNPTAAVSTAYLKAFYDKLGNDIFLRKDRDDETAYKLTMGEAEVTGNATVNGTTTLNGDTYHKANADFGIFEKGISGGRITNDADAELKSLVLRESLTVPKITYNCEEWIGGNTWRSQGGGVIKAVSDITDTEGNTLHIALLDIKADEGGKIAAGDKCQGIFHLTGSVSGGNASEDKDDHNGHFTFRGFKTIYFLINSVQSDDWLTSNATALMTAFGLTDDDLTGYNGMNAFFAYSLRSEVDTTWTDATHPQPQLNFAEYANSTEASRQQVSLTTPEYDLGLTGMVGWTYGESNIVYICRKLDGFTITDSKGNAHVLSGYGIAFGKAYMWGTIQQFDRNKLLVSQQIYRKASDSNSALTVAQIGTATDQNATEQLPYLWAYWHYTYDDGSTSDSDVYLAANYAQPGTSITIKDKIQAVYTSQAALEADLPTLADGLYAYISTDKKPTIAIVQEHDYSDDPVNPGDCYSCVADGHLYCAGSSSWVDCGNITGASIQVQYCSDQTFPDDLIHSTFQSGDEWMRIKMTTETVWGKPFRIVGQDSVIYSLVPEQTGVNIKADGTYSEEKLSVLVQKRVGNTVYPSVDYGTIYMLIDDEDADPDTLTGDDEDTDSIQFGDGSTIEYRQRIPYTVGGVRIADLDPKPTKNVKFILIDPDNVCIDVKTVPFNTDGANGESALVADLSNEMDSVALNVNGTVMIEQNLETVLSLYYGITQQTLTTLTAVCSNENVQIETHLDTGKVICQFDEGSSGYDDTMTVTITGTCTKGSLYKVFTINAFKAASPGQNAILYQLIPSLEVIQKDGTDYADSSLSCFVRKIDGTSVTEDVTYGTIKMKIDNGEEQDYAEITLAEIKPTSKVEYILYNENNTIIDRETVPVLSNGTKGKRGSSWRIINWSDAIEKIDKGEVTEYHFYDEEELTSELSIADIVIYDNVHYLCINAYTLTKDNKTITPPNAVDEEGNHYFQQFNEFSLVATGLLLAEEAIIKNLITERLLCETSNEDDTTGLTLLSTLTVGVDTKDNYPKLIFNVDAEDSEGVTTSEYYHNAFGVNGCYFYSQTGKYRNEIATDSINVTYNRTGYDPAGVFITGVTENDDGTTNYPKIELKGASGKDTILSADGLTLDGDLNVVSVKTTGNITVTDPDDGEYKGKSGWIKVTNGFLHIVKGVVVEFSKTYSGEYDYLE